MAFCAFLPLPTTVAFLIPSSPWLGPTPPLLSPSAADPLSALEVPSPLPPRTERLVRDRRTGTTMQTAEQLQDHIDRDLILEDTVAPLPTSYSLETVRVTLASLCPPVSDRDTSAQSTPLSVSAGEVMAILEKLPIGVAAGASGWTYAVMKAISLCASQLLVTFCNLMLSGQLRSQVWLRT